MENGKRKTDSSLDEDRYTVRVADEISGEKQEDLPSQDLSRNPSKVFAIMISVLLVVTGSCNTLAAK